MQKENKDKYHTDGVTKTTKKKQPVYVSVDRAAYPLFGFALKRKEPRGPNLFH